MIGDLRKWDDLHIEKSLKQVDANTWLFGPFLLRKDTLKSDHATWRDCDLSFTIEKAPTPLPAAKELVNEVYHRAGDASAIWKIGDNAFCKVHYLWPNVTPEWVNLDFVRKRAPTTFEIPQTLSYATDGDRSFLFLSRVKGRTLNEAWPQLNTYWRNHYVEAVVNAIKEMAQWTSHECTGVDGQHQPEPFLANRVNGLLDLSSIGSNCKTLGMDCSSFVFFHTDLGPGNIMVETANPPVSGKIGIIDWETAGFYPKDWILTKFRNSGGLKLSDEVSCEDTSEWPKSIARALKREGFVDFTRRWREWRGRPPIAELN